MADVRQDRIFNAKQTLVPKIRLLAEPAWLVDWWQQERKQQPCFSPLDPTFPLLQEMIPSKSLAQPEFRFTALRKVLPEA